MPLLKKTSYNLVKAQKNNVNSNTGTYTQIKEKKPEKSNNKFRSSIRIQFQSYCNKKRKEKEDINMPWFKKTKSYTLLKKSNKSKKSNTVTYTKKKETTSNSNNTGLIYSLPKQANTKKLKNIP